MTSRTLPHEGRTVTLASTPEGSWTWQLDSETTTSAKFNSASEAFWDMQRVVEGGAKKDPAAGVRALLTKIEAALRTARLTKLADEIAEFLAR